MNAQIWNITEIKTVQSNHDKIPTLSQLFIEECNIRGIQIHREGTIVLDNYILSISGWIFGESREQINLTNILAATRDKSLKRK